MCYHYKNNKKHHTNTRSLGFPPKTGRQNLRFLGGAGGGRLLLARTKTELVMEASYWLRH